VKEVSPCRNQVLLSQGHHPEPPIPDPILEKWQKIVNLMAEMLDVPAGLINKRLMTQFRDIVEILWRLSIRKRNAERS
jgi:hypothetical protein